MESFRLEEYTLKALISGLEALISGKGPMHHGLSEEHQKILQKISELYTELFFHNGFGELRLEMRFLRKGQKEIIVHCGKDYRYVVDYDHRLARPGRMKGAMGTTEPGNGPPKGTLPL